ncbi:MAG: hypothetical protein ABR520_05775 [Mycobacteriales bacterium]|nr:glycosyltransferase [Frankia sp.]
MAAWVLLGMAIAGNNGAFTEPALQLAVLAWLALLAAVVVARTGLLQATTAACAVATLGVLIAATYRAGIYAGGSSWLTARVLTFVAALLVASWWVGVPRWQRLVWPGVLIAMTFGGVAMIHASPRPIIDVWYLLQEGAHVLAHGGDVYRLAAPGSPDVKDVYPYLPMTAVAQLPFHALFGDVRYAYIAASGLASYLVLRVSRRDIAPLLAAVALIFPKVLFRLEQAWTEPLLFLWLALMVWAVVEGHQLVAVIAFAVALATKQHMFLLVPLAAWWPAFGVRRTLQSLGVAVLLLLPWFLAGPGDFVHDTLTFNLHVAPRIDALSLYSLALMHHMTPPFVLVPLVTLAALALAMWRLPRTAAGFVLGAAFTLATFHLVNKLSFFNEWSLVLELLVLAVAVHTRGEAAPASMPATTSSVGKYLRGRDVAARVA